MVTHGPFVSNYFQIGQNFFEHEDFLSFPFGYHGLERESLNSFQRETNKDHSSEVWYCKLENFHEGFIFAKIKSS